jgi:hypothetical protein
MNGRNERVAFCKIFAAAGFVDGQNCVEQGSDLSQKN